MLFGFCVVATRLAIVVGLSFAVSCIAFRKRTFGEAKMPFSIKSCDVGAAQL